MCKSNRPTSTVSVGKLTVEVCPTCVSWCQEVNMTSTIVRDPELADPKSPKAAHYCPETSQGTEEGVRLYKECLHEIQSMPGG